jgi:hypothetical protein
MGDLRAPLDSAQGGECSPAVCGSNQVVAMEQGDETMKEVDGIKILEDIELEGIVGGAIKKSVAKKAAMKKKVAKKKVAAIDVQAGGPELI